MANNMFVKRAVAVFLILLFLFASLGPNISGIITEFDEQQNTILETHVNDNDEVFVTCYSFGLPGEPSKEMKLSFREAVFLYDKIKELNFEVAIDPLSQRTKQLENEIIDLADDYHLLPSGLSKSQVKKQYIQSYRQQMNRVRLLPQSQSKASEFLCTFVSTGSGGVLPIIALPRLIPFLMIPIPRLFMIWRAQEAVTSCGGLRSGTGFIAYGQQNGLALGFWGLGFTFSLPPLMGVYGLAGYALYASVNAEAIEFYPPNSPPVISQIDPGNGEIDVALTLAEIRFQLSDGDGELMSYEVTTNPDIGSGSGNLKPDGVYSIPISGLKANNAYEWTIEVTDGRETITKTYSFSTVELPFDPFNDGWQYRKQVIINHEQVTGPVIHFPVLINTVDSDLADKGQDEGEDILFMDGDGVANKLYHEIEEFNNADGELTAWVRLEEVSPNEDTIFYMYYGNAQCGNQQYPKRVWSEDYSSVWHFSDFKDSTINANDGSNHGTTEILGKIHKAKDFDGINDYISVSDDPSLNFHGTNAFSLSFWILKKASDKGESIISKGTTAYTKGYNVHIRTNGSISFGIRTGSENYWCYSPSCINDSIWHYLTTVWNGSTLFIYIDGTLDISKNVGDKTIANDNKRLEIGDHYPENNNHKYALNAELDEIRFSSVPHNADWISTEFHNQNNPSSFIEIGQEETWPQS